MIEAKDRVHLRLDPKDERYLCGLPVEPGLIFEAYGMDPKGFLVNRSILCLDCARLIEDGTT